MALWKDESAREPSRPEPAAKAPGADEMPQPPGTGDKEQD